MLKAFLGLCLVLTVAVATTTATYSYVTYDIDTDRFTWHDGVTNGTWAARAEYHDTLDTIGWRKLHIHTSKDFTPEIQARAAGFIEGVLMYQPMYDHRSNLGHLMSINWTDYNQNMMVWLDKNFIFVQDKVNSLRAIDSYWYHVGLTLDQFLGLVDGYQYAAPEGQMLQRRDLWYYVSVGDMLDLPEAFSEPMKDPEYNEHCTGGVRLLDDFSDLFIGQDAWFRYGAMNRVLKHYNFAFGDSVHTAANEVIFSSYPGFAYSFDDFYTLDSQLVTLETTIGINNKTLYELYVKDNAMNCVLEWMRVTVANRYSRNGKDWVEIFSRYNSGTYNNQWLILDFNLFTPGEKPTSDLLYVLEQAPGTIMYIDATSILLDWGYFPSYNMPYITEMQELALLPEMLKHYLEHMDYEKYPTVDDVYDYFSYENCSRAKLFRHLMPFVANEDDFVQFMRYNNPTGNADQHTRSNTGIASRYDLLTNWDKKRGAFGDFDTKMTSARYAPAMAMRAISRPTTGSKTRNSKLNTPTLSVWNFTQWNEEMKQKGETDKVTVWQGLPEVYDFDWVYFSAQHCTGLDQEACFDEDQCGWCGAQTGCVTGDANGPFADSCPNYQFASRMTLYIGLVVGLVGCCLLLSVCWYMGVKEKKRILGGDGFQKIESAI